MADKHVVGTPLPGAPAIDDGLASRLADALVAKGTAYVPRTHHLVGTAPKFTNRLILEPSPYLLQHAHNPVNWFPWGDEAFAEARRLGRPIFMSIGYSTCHWCHVMEVESFEDEEIARFLNEHYVSIKVDREERPDIDAIYMSAVQALTGSGGWPMSVWMTPEREPFFGGTYFPPRDGARGAQHGFLTILNELRETYHTDPQRVKKAALALSGAVRQEMQGQGQGPSGGRSPAAGLPSSAVITTTVDYFKGAFDNLHGGVRRAPKFPSNVPIRLLLRHHRRAGDAEALRMATVTLEKMAGGGLYDQIGGGFHRYSTDARWLVPHFEKMLYDNALLSVAYAEAYQVTGRADFARVTRETLDYVLREMTDAQGGFYSATDADSEGEEGKFFVWSEAEVQKLLGAEAPRFMRYYGVTAGGNFEGHNILNAAHPDEGEWLALKSAREKLYTVRARRIAPLRDDKILAAWNGLMISGFAVAGRILGEPSYVDAAARAANFVLEKMQKDGRLMRSFKDGQVSHRGFLDDYAFVQAGLLDLFEASFDPRWLLQALALGEAVEQQFADAAHGGWFMTSGEHEKLLAREKPNFDGAEPSGTSVALLNVLRVGTFTGDDKWRRIAERAFGGLFDLLATKSVALTEALLAVDYLTDVPREIAIVWPAASGKAAAEPLLAVLRRTFLPNKALAGAPEGEGTEALAASATFIEGKIAQGAQVTAYVCEHGKCELPTHDPVVFAAQLKKFRGY
ncbi:MAG TPA: thioredoxin domain-containing protein [Polyangia bacterium]|nr:thioredoxin domain-containing protein [Polyangia bacterium]